MTTQKTVSAPAKTTAKKAVPNSAPAVANPKVEAKKPKKERKEKVVRDSFTMPKSEYLKIAEIKKASLKAGLPVKKSEVLRAGLRALSAMSAAQLKNALAGMGKTRAERPKKA